MNHKIDDGKSNKNWTVSLIRLISLIMIISCHILQGLNIEFAFWLNVGVQIFFFMSGYLYGCKKEDNKTKKINNWYKKQYIKIVTPLIILTIVMITIDKIFFQMNYSFETIIANMIGLGGFYGTLKAMSHTWFVSYILICYLLTPLLNNIKFNNLSQKQLAKQILQIAVFLEIIDFFHVVNINAAWIFNYIIGYYFSSYYVNEKKGHKKFDIFIILTCIIFLIPRLIFQYCNLDLPNIIERNMHILKSWSHVLLGSSIFIIMYNLFNKIKINNFKILQLSDKFSYCIYLVHQIFILNHLSILYFTRYLIVNVLLIIVLSLTFGIILYYFNYFLTNKIIKINRYLN